MPDKIPLEYFPEIHQPEAWFESWQHNLDYCCHQDLIRQPAVEHQPDEHDYYLSYNSWSDFGWTNDEYYG